MINRGEIKNFSRCTLFASVFSSIFKLLHIWQSIKKWSDQKSVFIDDQNNILK